MEPTPGFVRLIVVVTIANTASPFHSSLAAYGVLLVVALGLAGCSSDPSGRNVARLGAAEVPTPTASPASPSASPPAESAWPAEQPEPPSGTSLLDTEVMPSPDPEPAPEASSTPVSAPDTTPAPDGDAVDRGHQTPTPGPIEKGEIADSAERGADSDAEEVRRIPWPTYNTSVCCEFPRTSWLLAWDSGFLEIGSNGVATDRDGVTPSIVMRASPDGADWTAPSELNVPSVHFPVPTLEDWASRWSERWPPCWPFWCKPLYADPLLPDEHDVLVDEPVWTIFDVASTGQRLLVGSQWKDKIYVSVTSDLNKWETTEISLQRPRDLHPSLDAVHVARSIELGPDGWLVNVLTTIYVDFISLLPEDIADTAADFYIYRHSQDDGTNGLMIEYSVDESSYLDMERFISWEEFKIPPELFDAYGNVANKPYHPPWRMSGEVWSAQWGESPIKSELPLAHGGTCCIVVGTGSGYFAVEDTSGPGYGPAWGLPTGLFFSSDGGDWTEINHPAGEDAWINSFFALRDGVFVLSTSPVGYISLQETRAWRVSSDGLSWQQTDLPAFVSLPQWPFSNRGAVWLPDKDLHYLRFDLDLFAMIDPERLRDRATAINGDIAIWYEGGGWYGGEGTIERQVLR